MAERTAVRTPWTPQAVRAFEERCLAPISTGADLLELVCDLVDQLGRSFAKADMSSRPVIETAKDEGAVRDWLGSTLEQMSNGRFTCYREAQVMDQRRPDLIAAATSAPVEVALELKHDQKNWTLPQLGHALSVQLAEQYLQPAKRRHGVLVISNHRDSKFWLDKDEGKRVAFPAAITRLQKQAAAIDRNSAGLIRVEVRGLDAAPRGRRGGAAKDVGAAASA
jgi:hypothetical protein